MIVHHTDEKREWSYDKESHIGRLDKALEQAGKKGWSVIADIFNARNNRSMSLNDCTRKQS